jgi:hypothetical protein
MAGLVAACAGGGTPQSAAPTLQPPSAAVLATPAPTATPGPTATPSAAPSPTPAATSAPTPRPKPTPAATPVPTAAPTATPGPTRTLAPGETAAPTPLDLAPFLTAEITVVNLADAPLSVSVTIVLPESGEEFEIGTLVLAPLQVTTQSVLAARFRLAFDYPGGAASEAGTCVIELEEGDQVQFAVVTGGAVLTAGDEPEDPAELVVATAARCRAGATS